MLRPLSLVLIPLLYAARVEAADPAAGAAAFGRCRICHSVEAGGRNGVGPNLHGLFGRKAGSASGFAFSGVIRNSGIVWDEETLATFLRDPKNAVPGNRMAFPGIVDDSELADLLAYLKQATR